MRCLNIKEKVTLKEILKIKVQAQLLTQKSHLNARRVLSLHWTMSQYQRKSGDKRNSKIKLQAKLLTRKSHLNA